MSDYVECLEPKAILENCQGKVGKIFQENWKSHIAQRLLDVMKELDLNKGELAQAMQVSNNSLTTYIQAKYEPKASSLAALCESYNVSAQWLLLGQGPMLLDSGYQTQPSGWASQVKEAVEEYTQGLAPISQIYAAARHTIAEYVTTQEMRLLHKKILQAEKESNAAERHQAAARELYELKATVEDLDDMDPVDKKVLYRHILAKHYGSQDATGTIQSMAVEQDPKRRAEDDGMEGS